MKAPYTSKALQFFAAILQRAGDQGKPVCDHIWPDDKEVEVVEEAVCLGRLNQAPE